MRGLFVHEHSHIAKQVDAIEDELEVTDERRADIAGSCLVAILPGDGPSLGPSHSPPGRLRSSDHPARPHFETGISSSYGVHALCRR